MSTHILVIDDHPIFRQGLIALLSEEKDFLICGEADEGSSALKILRENNPSLIILDLSLKNSSGLQLLKRIRAEDKKVKILIASMHDEVLFAERCILAGANGYINKEEAPSKIVSAIRALLKNGFYLSDKMTIHIAQRNLQGMDQIKNAPEDILSNREMEVFMLIGKGHSTQKIADSLHLSTKTIDTHKEHIKKKLGIEDNVGLIQRAVAWSLTDCSI